MTKKERESLDFWATQALRLKVRLAQVEVELVAKRGPYGGPKNLRQESSE